MAVHASAYQYNHLPTVVDGALFAANALAPPTPPVGVAVTVDYTLGDIGLPRQQQLQQQRDQPHQQLPTALSATFLIDGGATATTNPGSGRRKRARDPQQASTAAAAAAESHAMMIPLQQQQQRQAALMQGQHGVLVPSPPSMPPPVSVVARSGAGAAVASTSGRQRCAQGISMVPPQPFHAVAATATATASASASALNEACLLTELQHPSLDIEAIVRHHQHRLRLALHQLRRRHFLATLAATERRIQLCLQAKQSELSAATQWNAELQDQVRLAEAEAQQWATAANKADALVTELYTRLNHATITVQAAPGRLRQEEGSGDNGEQATAAEEEESRCGGDEVSCDMPAATAAAAAGAALCRVCSSGTKNEATVVLLPCRHLCVCAACETEGHGVLACPVCGVPKNASLQVAVVPNID